MVLPSAEMTQHDLCVLTVNTSRDSCDSAKDRCTCYMHCLHLVFALNYTETHSQQSVMSPRKQMSFTLWITIIVC